MCLGNGVLEKLVREFCGCILTSHPTPLNSITEPWYFDPSEGITEGLRIVGCFDAAGWPIDPKDSAKLSR